MIAVNTAGTGSVTKFMRSGNGTSLDTSMVIDSSGNVGIGTTSPSTTLQLTKANTEVLANQPAWPTGILEITDTSAYNAGTGATIVFKKKRDSAGNQVTVGAIAGEGIGGNSQLSFWTGDAAYMGTAPKMVIKNTGEAGIGTTTPKSKLQVAGGIQMADDTDTASADKVGTQRYRETTGASYVDMVMRTSATTYEWINIVRNVWSV